MLESPTSIEPEAEAEAGIDDDVEDEPASEAGSDVELEVEISIDPETAGRSLPAELSAAPGSPGFGFGSLGSSGADTEPDHDTRGHEVKNRATRFSATPRR